MAPIRLGFVGLSSQGWASSTLAPPLFQSPLSSKYRVVAVSTSNPESAAESAKKYSELASTAAGEDVKVKPYHGSTENISADPDVDMVAVSIKTMGHREAAMKVIEAGKDLFLEWPAGRNAKETGELQEAAAKKGIKTIVGTQTRTASFAKTVKSIIDSGKIGKIVSSTFIVSFTDGFNVWGKYSYTFTLYELSAANGAGMLDIGGGHALDLFTYVLGPIASLSSTTFNPYPEAEVVDKDGSPTGKKVPQDIPVQVAVSGLLHNDAVFSFHLQASVKKETIKFLWLIDGEDGTIRMEDPVNTLFQVNPDVFLNGEKVEVEQEEDGFTRVRRAWDAFADGRVGEYASLEDALRTRRVVDAIIESGIEGRKIVLN